MNPVAVIEDALVTDDIHRRATASLTHHTDFTNFIPINQLAFVSSTTSAVGNPDDGMAQNFLSGPIWADAGLALVPVIARPAVLKIFAAIVGSTLLVFALVVLARDV